jgi:hypothetical protein
VGGFTVKNIRLKTARTPLPLEWTWQGVRYVWRNAGDVVSVPAELAGVLLRSPNPFGTFMEVAP